MGTYFVTVVRLFYTCEGIVGQVDESVESFGASGQ